MSDISGGLIQMTAHMVVRPEAHGWMVAGLIVAALFGFMAVCAALSKHSEHRRRYVAAFLAIALAGCVMTWAGAKQPRRKEIYCCASGPVSLEQVAARYEIIEVDGAFLKIAER